VSDAIITTDRACFLYTREHIGLWGHNGDYCEHIVCIHWVRKKI